MRIVVAMSGGVDSSVAAALLAEQGHEVIGLSMQLYDQAAPTDGQRSFGSCCTLDDLHDARRVAAAINIPHYILNFERQFDEQVVSNFVREYAAGRTPLPCAHCNSDLKFATLADRARGLGANAVATGHYARVERDVVTGQFLLKRGVDPSKDQSYFLFSLTQAQLARALFPVGDRPKDAVREYARLRRLPVADKPDSQEICFIPDHDYATFVTTHAPETERDGTIVDERGRVLGRHGGIHRFTIGQRRGLGLGGGTPRYVTGIDAASGTVRVGPKAEVVHRGLVAERVHWTADPVDEAAVRIRHRHQPVPARLIRRGASTVEAWFEKPASAVTPGQAAVFYRGDEVVGGGWIAAAL